MIPPNPSAAALYEGARIWTFSGTVGRQLVMVACQMVIPRGASDEQKQTDLKEAAARFGTFVSRLSVRVAP